MLEVAAQHAACKEATPVHVDLRSVHQVELDQIGKGINLAAGIPPFAQVRLSATPSLGMTDGKLIGMGLRMKAAMILRCAQDDTRGTAGMRLAK